MITRKTEPRFFLGDAEFKTLEEAQWAALAELAKGEGSGALSPELLLREKVKVMDILSTTERSLTKARAINGGRKPRKAKTNVLSIPAEPKSE